MKLKRNANNEARGNIAVGGLVLKIIGQRDTNEGMRYWGGLETHL